MKRIFTLIFILCGLIATMTTAQERYLDEMFSEVQVTTEVYGVNATLIELATAMEAVPQALVMDVYEPVGDTETDRPVMLVFHTGNFLPVGLNAQISGSLRDSSVVEFCTLLAKRGYVAASVDYRSGWNPLASTQPLRALGIIQAAYRGVQDSRNAVRFMRALAVDAGNKYNIDPDKIAALGQGTGGYVVLGMVGLDDYNEILTTRSGPAKFILDNDGDGTPETPMIVEAFHGDVEGRNLTVTPAAGFGLPAGDTTNYVNVPNYADGTEISSDIALGINLGGALGDVSWLDDNTIPTITIQSINDAFAPYNDGVLQVSGTEFNVVQVQGAQVIGESQRTNGANQIFVDAVFDDATTQLARDNSAIAGHDYYEGVFPFNLPANSLGLDEGLAIEWWNPNAPVPAYLGAPMGTTWALLPHPSMMGTFNEVGQLRNENMSGDKARANIATCLDYILPRSCVALELPCASFYSSTEDLLEESLVDLTPNPSSAFINLSSEKQIKSVEMLDMQGKLISKTDNINNNNFRLDNTSNISGMHLINIRFEDGMVTKTVIIE